MKCMKTVMVDLYGTLIQLPEYGPIEKIIDTLNIDASHHQLVHLCDSLGLFSRTISSLAIWESVMLSLGHSKEEARQANKIWLESSRHIRLFPNTHEFLSSIKKQGHKLILATAVDRDSYELLENQFKFTQYFDEVMTTFSLGVRKSKEFYEKICERLILLPKDTIMIGDNIEYDIQPAHACGMNTILLNRYLLTDYQKDDLPKQSVWCKSYQDTLKQIEIFDKI